ncbi:RNA 2'-phosphotransferase [Deminuibacter soli]|uniref:Probable RNA 2'-phosphotransferase n=1 Tax=Deminuibacter soli TaxID=2291815 RepID=A0A3E1NMK4_9BACT|nr:RNA 2'-phosphotransferase [Deminuibacter soli]
MNETEARITSQFLSLFLRHKPQIIELTLDEQGWVSVNKLVDKMNKNGFPISPELLDYVVANNDKQRFTFNEDRTKIRAAQGHSVDVNLNYNPIQPPTILYHGTGKPSVPSILSKGIDKRTRLHVHLSHDKETATTVGSRHGQPYVFAVAAGQMHQDGHPFYLSDNQVWLTPHVPAQYIELLEA